MDEGMNKKIQDVYLWILVRPSVFSSKENWSLPSLLMLMFFMQLRWLHGYSHNHTCHWWMRGAQRLMPRSSAAPRLNPILNLHPAHPEIPSHSTLILSKQEWGEAWERSQLVLCLGHYHVLTLGFQPLHLWTSIFQLESWCYLAPKKVRIFHLSFHLLEISGGPSLLSRKGVVGDLA